VKISEDTVEDYAEIIDASKDWPFGPLDVFHDGSDYFLADGFHRTLAALRLNRASLPCRVHKGTAGDAKIFGMTANDKHGLRMSQADKRACVEWLLDNGPKLTQVEIAAKAGVTDRTVRAVVAERKEENRKSSGSASKTLGKSSETGDKPTPTPSSKASQEPADESDDVPFDAPDPPATPEASIMLDALGKQIPKNLRSASELAILLVATGRDLDKFRKAAKDFAEQPGGDWLRVQDISDGIKVLKDHFQQAAYHTACVKCGGKGCKTCEMTGWIPDYLRGTL
jgi:hypothetical protein